LLSFFYEADLRPVTQATAILSPAGHLPVSHRWTRSAADRRGEYRTGAFRGERPGPGGTSIS